LTSSKHNKRKYLGYLLYLVPIAIILLAYLSIIVATNEPEPFTIVSGPSMQPTILSGSIVIIAKTPFNQLKVGDVIVFIPIAALQDSSSCQTSAPSSLSEDALNPCYVIHRIVIISNTKGKEILTTSGDHNGISPDPCLPSAPRSIQGYDCDINSSMYVGQVILQFPALGYLTQTPYKYYIIGLVLLVLAVDLLYFERGDHEDRSEETPL
jgi:signal peptidase I